MFRTISLIVTVFCISAAASAAPEKAAKKGEAVTVARLSDSAVKTIVTALESKPIDTRALNEAIPNFKVPAITKQVLICEVTRSNVLTCFEQNEAERCPTEVQLRVDGLDNLVTVPVTCEPNTPDANGQCECELS